MTAAINGGRADIQKLNENGATTGLPTTDPGGPSSGKGGNTWEMEESLDIEWAHAIAPMANIDLFEAPSGGLYNAVLRPPTARCEIPIP